jgi:hypothetical protein
MSFDLFDNDTCRKCRKPIEETSVEPHPTRRDLAIHNFRCANCGALKTKVLFLKPGKPLPESPALGHPAKELVSSADHRRRDNIIRLVAARRT